MKDEPLLSRLLAVIASTCALALLVPLFILVGLAIKCTSAGPVLYRQQRVGRQGKVFTLYKFRTMVQGADTGAAVTGANDRRITSIGRFLRKYKIDELPQLINVMKGDMALVGPRPEVPKYVAHYTEEQRALLLVRPGITDPATLFFRDKEAALLAQGDHDRCYLEEVLPKKLAMSLEYLRHRTFLSDLRIILLTLVRLVK